MVLFSQRRPPDVPDQSRAVLLAARVGAKAVSLHPQGLRGRDCCQPRPCEGKSVGKHDWVVRFLRGARRLNPTRPPSIPSWDLSLVLRALQQGPFEPFQTVEPKFLSMKTLLALASIKRVGDLHAFSVDDSCLQFGPADSQIILRPWPGYVPKVTTTPFRDQVVSLQALPPKEAEPALAFLCPVRALRHYVDSTQSFKTSSLSVTEAGRKGMPSPSRGWPTE